jgi:hypothetical protein
LTGGSSIQHNVASLRLENFFCTLVCQCMLLGKYDICLVEVGDYLQWIAVYCHLLVDIFLPVFDHVFGVSALLCIVGYCAVIYCFPTKYPPEISAKVSQVRVKLDTIDDTMGDFDRQMSFFCVVFCVVLIVKPCIQRFFQIFVDDRNPHSTDETLCIGGYNYLTTESARKSLSR